MEIAIATCVLVFIIAYGLVGFMLWKWDKDDPQNE